MAKSSSFTPSPAGADLGIGMSVPGAAGDAGLGDMLQAQVTGETEEQRKRRMAQLAQQNTALVGASPAAMALGLGLGRGV